MKIIEKILFLVFFLILTLFCIQVIQKVTGHSPAATTIIGTGLALTIAYLLSTTYHVSKFMGEMTEFKENTKTFFDKIDKRMDKLEGKMDYGFRTLRAAKPK